MEINFKEKILPVLLLPVKYAVVWGLCFLIVLVTGASIELFNLNYNENVFFQLSYGLFILFCVIVLLTAPAIIYILLFSQNKLSISTFIVNIPILFIVLYPYSSKLSDPLVLVVIMISVISTTIINVIHLAIIKIFRLKQKKFTSPTFRLFFSVLWSVICCILFFLLLNNFDNYLSYKIPSLRHLFVVLLFFIIPICYPLLCYFFVFSTKMNLNIVTILIIMSSIFTYLSCLDNTGLQFFGINILIAIGTYILFIKVVKEHQYKNIVPLYVFGFVLYLIAIAYMQAQLH